jgi:histone acetyltransferase (RNA polymerase elongator complex component)
MISSKELTIDDEFMHYIQIKNARNISGVNAFAILLAPYPDNNEGFNGCKHDCFYCPNETKANGAQRRPNDRSLCMGWG